MEPTTWIEQAISALQVRRNSFTASSAKLGDKDSNPDSEHQKLASCPLDDPRMEPLTRIKLAYPGWKPGALSLSYNGMRATTEN